MGVARIFAVDACFGAGVLLFARARRAASWSMALEDLDGAALPVDPVSLSLNIEILFGPRNHCFTLLT